MKRVFASLAALSALTIPGIAGAQAPTQDTVLLGGNVIMRVRVPAGGMTIEQRTSSLQLRLNKILSMGPINPDDVTVEPFGSEAVVKVKDQLLFTADWDTARYNQSTPLELAQKWAAHMRE